MASDDMALALAPATARAASAWGTEEVDTLEGSALEWSTIEEAAGRAKVVRAKCCLFCRHSYVGGPHNIRQHLDEKLPCRNVRACKPRAQFKERHSQVVKELRARAREAEKRAKEKEEREQKREQGRALAVVSESGTSLALSQSPFSLTPTPHPFQAVTVDDVCEAWLKVIVKRALPLDLVEDRLFREAVAMTAKCGSRNMLVGAETRLPCRKVMTQKMLPIVEARLDEKIRRKVQGLAELTGVTIISDGWTNVSHKPIINCLASLPLGSYFIAAQDTSGATKDATYIKDFIVKHIQGFGSEHVVAVCMDGACTASFPLIAAECPHVFSFICPAHSLDCFMKNVCSDKGKVRVKGLTDREFDWGEPFLAKMVEQVREVVSFITAHQKTLARYRALCQVVTESERPVGGMELLKACETRFASTLLMLMRYKNVHFVLERLMIDPVYNQWVDGQSRDRRDKAQAVKRIIRSDDIMDTIKVAIQIMEPVYRLLRLCDGKLGANLGKVYGYMLQIDTHLRTGIAALDARKRHKIHELLMARWEYFHAPVMTAAYCLEPEYCRRKFSSQELKELKACLKQMATRDHSYPDILADLADFQEACTSGLFDLTDDVAFSNRAKTMASYKWANVYLSHWPHLKWAACRLLALSCSASGCERSWSVEDWIHSKKRNRLGQTTVERLVRCHTNLVLEDLLKDWESHVLPWELEMVVEEPEDENDC